MPLKKYNIEKQTSLIPELVAQIVSEEVLREVFAQDGKPLTDEHYPEFQNMVEDATEKLAKRAKDLFQNNEDYRNKLMGKGNSGRDYMYLFMYHWMGVMDERVFSQQVAHAKGTIIRKEFIDNLRRTSK